MPRSAVSRIAGIYRDLDLQVKRFQLATGLRCSAGCGVCCENPAVEATVAEVLPLARKLYGQGDAEATYDRILQHLGAGNDVCVMYRPDPVVAGKGRCAVYSARPLLCRLFGFAARKNRRNQTEHCPCRVIEQVHPMGIFRADAPGVKIPIYQDAFMRVACLAPDLGFQHHPINIAIRKALEFLYWKLPKDSNKTRRAA